MVEQRIRAVASQLSPDFEDSLLRGGRGGAEDCLIDDARAIISLLSHVGDESSGSGGPASVDAISHVAWIAEWLLDAATAADRFESDRREARVDASGIELGPNPAPSLDYLNRAKKAMREAGCDEETIACGRHAARDLEAINAKELELFRLLQEYLPNSEAETA